MKKRKKRKINLNCEIKKKVIKNGMGGKRVL